MLLLLGRKRVVSSRDTFLMYSHEQTAHLTAGVAERMSKSFPIFNMEGVTAS